MAVAVTLLLIGLTAGALIAACGRGARIEGTSWFDIPHETGRAARRTRHRAGRSPPGQQPQEVSMAESTLPEPTAEDRARSRFFTAQNSAPASDAQKTAVAAINDGVVALAVLIEEHSPHSRNKSLALTALEDVSMRANRAVFATGPNA